MHSVLYDITTLGNIHCAPGVTGAGIFRAAESLALALDRRDDVELRFSTSPSQYRKALRYLAETQRFQPSQFAVPSLSEAGHVASLPVLESGSGETKRRMLEFLDATYSPERVYNDGGFDIYHVGWRGEEVLPEAAFPSIVLTIYDVIALKRPDWFVEPGAANPIGDYLRRLLGSVRRHHRIIVNTESVKRDILELFPHISSEQVHVVALGVSDSFFRRPDVEVERVRAKYEIPEGHRYVLCVNTLEPRKNMRTVIEAYTSLVRFGSADGVSLVLVGAKGWLHSDLEALVEGASDLKHASIIFAGYVDDADIPALYTGSSLFCYPSLDEGFGLPLIEAMRCGTPVLTSDRAALRETSGGAALCVDPTDVEAVAEGMSSILNTDSTASELRRQGTEWADRFTWDAAAAAVTEVYDGAVEMRSARRSSSSQRTGARLDKWSVLDRVIELGADGLDEPSLPIEGLYRGNRAFVIGDSTATADAPLDLFGNDFTFVTNEFARFYDRTTWKPSFYVAMGDPLSDERCAELNALTGSVLFVESTERERLRPGDEIVSLELRPGSPNIVGISGSAEFADVELLGAERAYATSLQLAAHLGFDPIFVVAPETTTNGSNDARSPTPYTPEMIEWHHSFERWADANGVRVLNLSPSSLPNVYQRADAYEALAVRPLSEYQRTDAAHVDETEVVAAMFRSWTPRKRTMVDVGAHRGTSATFFVDDDWTIHCFEPDADNRSHLERKFGSRENLTIDVRAVGEAPQENVAFFASAQSSGISGLSAFHDSHREAGRVDITTVRDIMVERELQHIDFLKIDVEGFDFGVLKGVPWELVRPDVIECEYEDAKTLPLGHNWRDIAQYLVELGYSVYVSEWHPIVQYGVRHDWRRVVPFPGIEPSENSWGNLLAFKSDPGLETVQAAFEQLIDFGEPGGRPQRPSPAAPRKIATRATPAENSRNMTARPAYADWGDRLRRASPAVYRILRTARRASVSALRRWKTLASVGLVLLGLVLVGLLVDGGTARLTISVIAVAVVALAGMGLLVGRVYAIAQRQLRSDRRLEGQSSATKRSAAEARRAASDAFNVGQQLTAARLELDRVSQKIEQIERSAALRESEEAKHVAAATESLQQMNESIEQLRRDRANLDQTQSDHARRLVEVESAATAAGAGQRRIEAELASFLDRRSGHSNYVNSSAFRMSTRRLTSDDVTEIREVWLKQFALDLTDREILYMAHKLCMDEEACEGRLATSIQAGMMRALALLSIRSSEIEVLEIGTLCGIGAGSLHRVGTRARRRVRLTLIDPLSGYYDSSMVDRQTGVAIDRDTLERNLAALSVPPDDYRIIQHLSTDEAATKAASDRKYDFVLIDGDHSLTGVSNDYELYSGLVKPGGLLVFDDYDTEDWPAIKPFVDEHVRPNDEWLWLGGHWRTGVLQRKPRRLSLD